MVTGEQARAAVMAAGLTYIPHHDCGCCGEWVAYTVHDGNLYFNPACGCSWSPAEPRTWDSAADWINMQSNEDVRTKLMAKFGMTPKRRATRRAASGTSSGAEGVARLSVLLEG